MDRAKIYEDWSVDQLTDFFHTTTKIKTQQVIKSRGQHCGDIELAGYLANVTGPVSLVLDLRITHDRVGSSPDPTLNGHLRYPNNLDQSLNDTAADKKRKYRSDYNNNLPSVVSFMPDIASTSGRLHSEFIRLLFLQSHLETDRFFTDSGVPLTQSTSGGFFHFRRVLLEPQVKTETYSLRLNLYVLILT